MQKYIISGSNLGCWVDSELQLGFLSVVNRETFHKEGGEPRSGTATEGVEDKESLESSALISKLPDTVKDQVNNLLTWGRNILHYFWYTISI